MSALPWLPRKPDDFRERVRSLRDQAQVGEAIQALAASDLDSVAATTLSKAIGKLRGDGVGLSPLSKFRLGVVSSFTFDLVAGVLPAAAARYGVDLELIVAPFGQVAQEILDPSSHINAAGCDAVLIAVDHRWLQVGRPRFSVVEGQRQVEESLALLRDLATAVKAAGSTPILPTLACEPHFVFGNFDRAFAGSPRAMIDSMNRGITQIAVQTGSNLLDVAALAEMVGTVNWFSPSQWNSYKLSFAAEYDVLYADGVGRLMGAIRGKAKKCLVLDLDNTIWAGVVGDDGIGALRIGEGSPEGEAHLDVQRLALDLRDRGIILAVSSKNNDDVARGPFREHPDMLLKENDLAVFQANWIDKPSNLEAIAKTLNIGIDALVLLDDNPAERAHVRAALPMVAVPELPADVSSFARYLALAGCFEAVSFSDEDRLRAKSYAADAQRAEVMSTASVAGDYLSALQMVIKHAPFDALGRQRISQLINKSNQFNLTTRRYTEAEVARLETDELTFTMQSRLSDRFGELGMISVVICREVEHRRLRAWIFDSWLMSCRVLGRKVEQAVLDEVAKAARRAGVAYLLGEYRPSPKNGMVKDHYAKLGFSLVDEDASGRTITEFDLRQYSGTDLPMVVESSIGSR